MLVIDRQEALDVLFIGQPDLDAVVADGFFHLPQSAFIRSDLFLWAQDQQKFSGRSGGELDLIQVLHVLLQKPPECGDGLRLQSCLIEGPVGLKGLTGIQRQQLYGRLRAEQIGERRDTAPDPFFRLDREVVRTDQEENHFPLGSGHAMRSDALDPHELPGGLMLPERDLFLSGHGSNLHS